MPADIRRERTVHAAAVIVAAGRGLRFGAPDKVLLPLAGRPMLAHVLDATHAASAIRSVVVVVGEHTREPVERLVAAGGWEKVVAVVVGGARRQDSVAAGFAATPADAEAVVVHDGARPLAGPALFDACAEEAARCGAAIAATPVTDTLKRVGGTRRVETTIPRDALWAAQTPQAFRRDLLAAALASPVARESTFTDEAALFEALGHQVAVVPGDTGNIKVTHPGDLVVAEALSGLPGSARPGRDAVMSGVPFRTGIGYDIHRLVPGRPLVLGGVSFDHPLGLDGHSDADVLLHAIADALLGAAALGDIGHHFPVGDPAWAGADSRRLLRATVALLRDAGWAPANVDATVIAEAPKIGPAVARMRTEIAGCAGLPVDAVSVKATTNETLGALGRSEGIAALATAMIARLPEGGA